MKRFVLSLVAFLCLAFALGMAFAWGAGSPSPAATISAAPLGNYSVPAPLGGYSIKGSGNSWPAAAVTGIAELKNSQPVPPAPLAGHSISGYRYLEPEAEFPVSDEPETSYFSLALADYNSGRYVQAASAASGMVRTFAGTPWEGRAAFLAGRAYCAMKDFPSASGFFAVARQKLPALADYSLYILAGGYSDSRMYEDEAKTYMLLVREHPESPLAPESAVRAAEAYLALGRYREVIETLDLHKEKKLNASIAAKSLYLRMEAYEKLGDTKAAGREYRTLWLTYPEFSLSAPSFKIRAWDGDDYMVRGDALFEKGLYGKALECYRDALKKLPKKSPQRAEAYLKLGGTYFRLRDNDKAEDALKDALAGKLPKDKVPEALYLLAKTYLRDGAREKFREAAHRCERLYPRDPLADDCLYLLGTTMSQEGEFDAAVESFKRLIENFPDSDKRDDTLWQMGWAFYKKGAYRESEKVLGRLAGEFPDSQLAPQAIYWRGKSLEALGETASAQVHYNELRERYGLSFYGLLAGSKGMTVIDPAAWEAPANVEAQEPPQNAARHYRDPRLARVYELVVQGMKERAGRELKAAEAGYSGSLEGLKAIAGLYEYIGEYRRPLELASQLYKSSLGSGKGHIPDEALRMLFPLKYWTTINLEAYALKLDPMLISGVIREESHYNPSAVSPAGAVGLMQLMPSTAGLICRRLSLKTAATAEELKNYDFNVPIGARYLDSLVKRHGGRLAHALAEYNAGPGALEKWEKKNPGASDDYFIESIEFMETRNYVKRVLRNYYMYRKLYGTKES